MVNCFWTNVFEQLFCRFKFRIHGSTFWSACNFKQFIQIFYHLWTENELYLVLIIVLKVCKMSQLGKSRTQRRLAIMYRWAPSQVNNLNKQLCWNRQGRSLMIVWQCREITAMIHSIEIQTKSKQLVLHQKNNY